MFMGMLASDSYIDVSLHFQHITDHVTIIM